MKQFIKNIVLGISLMVPFFCSSCSDEDTAPGTSYGYVQFKLQQLTQRSLLEGSELTQMTDARKIEVTLRYAGGTLRQTLNLSTANPELATYGLTSDNMELQPGEYTLVNYVLYGAYKEGNMSEVLQVGTPDSDATFTVKGGQMTVHPVYVHATLYGMFTAQLTKSFPIDYDEVLKRSEAPSYSNLFDYDAIDSVRFVMERRMENATIREEHKMKTWREKTDPYFHTDTIALQTGDYTITYVELFNKKGNFLYAQEVEMDFVIETKEQTEQAVPVEFEDNEALRDYIALYQIWSAMDGKNWSNSSDAIQEGANWFFTFPDGTPRPMDAWGNQPGVGLNSKGRVVSLNLGAFNPAGVVPAAIGELTALETLYLGTHTEEYYIEGNEGTGGHYRYDPFTLASEGIDLKAHRMEIAMERSRLRRASQESTLYRSRVNYSGQPLSTRFVRTYQQNIGTLSNRITGIDEAIGKLSELSILYIANGLMTELPASLSQLKNLTDVELFNLPLKEIDADLFNNMNQLTSVNISGMYDMEPSKLMPALENICKNCSRVQLLYINDNNLQTLPENLPRLTDLRLLDAAYNRITTLKSILPIAPIQLMLDCNLLEEIPANFCSNVDLELFTATANKLKTFPAFLSNKKNGYVIEEIDLTANEMHGFQEGFNGILAEKLLMAINCMGKRTAYVNGEEVATEGDGSFPREFSDTESEVNYFVLANNNIDTIKPSAVRNFKNTQAFDCSGNNLKYMPHTFNRVNFPYLTGLELSRNQFREFPTEVLNVSSLSQLLINSQGYFRDAAQTQWVRTMTEWPTGIESLGALNILDVSGNDFREVGMFPANLNYLDITDNPNIIITVPVLVQYRMLYGEFDFYYDEEQDVTFEN